MYPGLVSCPFYAIPIYPFKFMKFLFTCNNNNYTHFKIITVFSFDGIKIMEKL